MSRRGKIFRNNGSQLLRIPKEFQFGVAEVFLRRQGEDLLLSVRPTDWSGFLGSKLAASNWFLTGVADAQQERW